MASEQTKRLDNLRSTIMDKTTEQLASGAHAGGLGRLSVRHERLDATARRPAPEAAWRRDERG